MGQVPGYVEMNGENDLWEDTKGRKEGGKRREGGWGMVKKEGQQREGRGRE